MPIALYLIGGLLAARFINWSARRIVRRIDAEYQETDQLVRTESAKHRQAVASVISWVSVALLFVIVIMQVTSILAIPVGSLVAPAAVLGAALGFGAQRVVQDLLSGFFIITEKQYGFGDLVSLTVAGIALPAEGTVEDVTLRVTKLRSSEGEMFTIPNGQIVKTVNLSKDWARAVIDIPVPTSADLNVVNDLLHGVAEKAMEDPSLSALLLDAPQLMGVESIELDTVNLRMVARTLAGQAVRGGPPHTCAGRPCAAARRDRVAHRKREADGGSHRPPGDDRRRGGRNAGPAGGPEMTVVVEGQARGQDAGLDGHAPRRVHRTVLGVPQCRAHPRPRAARTSGRAAGLRARPELHVGASHERATAQREPRDHDHHDNSDNDHDQPDGDHDDQPYVADDESHVADGNHPDDDRGGSGRFGPAGADYRCLRCRRCPERHRRPRLRPARAKDFPRYTGAP